MEALEVPGSHLQPVLWLVIALLFTGNVACILVCHNVGNVLIGLFQKVSFSGIYVYD
jgi:hypothetical protein